MMNWRIIASCVCAAFVLFGCATDMAVDGVPQSKAQRIASPIQCVPFARETSGIEIYGNAHTWWEKAQPRYQRGYVPVNGAVFVMPKQSRLGYGHVAVVKRIINSRVVEVAHANWGDTRARRSIIYYAMPMEDISEKNDWSRVRLWNYELKAYGLPYRGKGFIYPNRVKR